MTATPQTITTAEQLEQAGDIGRCELVRGELIMMSPASGWHGWSANDLAYHITHHVRQHKLGAVLTAEPGFLIARQPDTVRAPDIAFVNSTRLHIIPQRGYVQGPPDLAVEVISPRDTATEVMDKVDQWREAGCPLVWVVDPQRRVVTTYSASERRVLRQDDTLTADDILPGFALRVGDIFPR